MSLSDRYNALKDRFDNATTEIAVLESELVRLLGLAREEPDYDIRNEIEDKLQSVGDDLEDWSEQTSQLRKHFDPIDDGTYDAREIEEEIEDIRGKIADWREEKDRIYSILRKIKRKLGVRGGYKDADVLVNNPMGEPVISLGESNDFEVTDENRDTIVEAWSKKLESLTNSELTEIIKAINSAGDTVVDEDTEEVI